MNNGSIEQIAPVDFVRAAKHQPIASDLQQKNKIGLSNRIAQAFCMEYEGIITEINPDDFGEPWGKLYRKFISGRGASLMANRWKQLMIDAKNYGIDPGEFAQQIFTQKGNVSLSVATLPGLHSLADAFKPLPPIDWIVESIAAPGTVGVFFGQPGSLKTYALIDMAICVSLGKEWCGNKTRKAKVLIVDEESGERRMAERLQMAVRGHLAEENKDELANLFTYTCLQRFNLREPESINQLETYVQYTGAELVIMDALADFTPGADENTTKDMLPAMMALRTIAERYQCAILLIHHANKQGNYRGSTAILGAVDLMVGVSFDRDLSLLKFETTKTRDTDAFIWAAKVHFDDGEYWLEHYHPEPGEANLGKIEQYIAACIAAGNKTRKWMLDHAAESGLSADSVRVTIPRLVKKGLIYRTNPNKSKRIEAIYDFTPGFGIKESLN